MAVRVHVAGWIAVVFVSLCGASDLAAQTVSSTMPADWPAGISVPVCVPFPTGIGQGMRMASVHTDGSAPPKRAAAQIEPADASAGTPARAWVMWDAAPADRGKKVTITFEKAPPVKAALRSRYADPLLTVSAGGGDKPFLTYYHGKPELGQRSPLTDFIHPLIGMDGEPLTALRPQDHEHHRGVFWAWVRHEQNDKALGDWWQPTDIFLEPGPIQSADGPLFTRFTAQHTWVYQPKAGKPDPFMNEYVVCRVFPMTSQGQAIDIDLNLVALQDTLRLGGTIEKEKGYGGFAFRYAQAAQPSIVADGRHLPRDMNQLHAAWVDYSGVFTKLPGQPNTQRTGAAVFADPSHPGFPPEWITRLYGLLNVSYPGPRLRELTKGQALRLRYRIWVHRGDAAQGQVDSAYKAFAAGWQWLPAAATQTSPAK